MVLDEAVGIVSINQVYIMRDVESLALFFIYAVQSTALKGGGGEGVEGK